MTHTARSPAPTRPASWTPCSSTRRYATTASAPASTTSPCRCWAWATSPPTRPSRIQRRSAGRRGAGLGHRRDHRNHQRRSPALGRVQPARPDLRDQRPASPPAWTRRSRSWLGGHQAKAMPTEILTDPRFATLRRAGARRSRNPRRRTAGRPPQPHATTRRDVAGPRTAAPPSPAGPGPGASPRARHQRPAPARPPVSRPGSTSRRPAGCRPTWSAPAAAPTTAPSAARPCQRNPDITIRTRDPDEHPQRDAPAARHVRRDGVPIRRRPVPRLPAGSSRP